MAKTGVSKNGNKYEVNGLELTDPQVVLVLSAAESDGIDLDDYVTRAIGIGVQALLATNVSLGVDQLTSEISRAKKEMEDASKAWASELDLKVKAVAGEGGTLPTTLTSLLEAFSSNLDALAKDEKSPIRQGMKAQIDDFKEKLVDSFTAVSNSQRQMIAGMFDINNAESPLNSVSIRLDAVDLALKAIQTNLDQETGRALEATKGTRKGSEYEVIAIEDVAAIARRSNDEPLASGGTPGAGGRAKKGDAVVRLKEGLKVKGHLVVEAKDRSTIGKMTDIKKLQYWQDEAAGARKTRGAAGFLGLCKHIEDMPGGMRIVVLDSLGQDIVLAYNPDEEGTELLDLTYQVVKMHCLSVLSAGTEINPVAMNSYIQTSLATLKDFNVFHSAVGAIKTQLDKITSTAETLSDRLNSNLRAMSREMAGAVNQFVLEDSSLEALEGDSKREIEE